MRVITAMLPAASVTAGRIRWLSDERSATMSPLQIASIT